MPYDTGQGFSGIRQVKYSIVGFKQVVALGKNYYLLKVN